MSPQESDPVRYRRNGKKQACEPCRKGKLACDHGSPFCGRCTRRKTTSVCIYHPAPMTRTPQQISRAASEQSQQPYSPPLPSGVHLSSPSVSGVPPDYRSHPCGEPSGATAPQKTVSTPGQPKPGWKNAVFPSSARYYGPTSFSAIFSEHQVKLNEELLDISENVRKHPGAWTFGEPLLGRHRPNGPTAREERTLRVLRNIPPKNTCSVLLHPTHSANIHVATLDMSLMQYFNHALWYVFEPELCLPQTDERLRVLSDVLFKNEEKPLPSCPDNGIEWANTFTGENIRFEMLGLFFCYIGLAYRSLQDWDPLFKLPENEGRDRMQTAWRMNECAEVCLRMCDDAETVNYLVPALILNLKKLQTGCTGDDTYQMRRLHGDMVTTAITSGLHRLPSYGSSKVTVASEFKRRIWSSIYYNDKTHASLYGTPPLLNHRYCDIEACLDLPDNILMLPETQLEQILTQIGHDGWNNSDKHLAGTTLLRAKMKLGIIREEILELALGVNIEVSRERIEDVHQRGQQIYEALPRSVHYHGEGKTPPISTGGILFDQAFLLLLYLQNKFLTDRVAIARGLANEQGLLDTALEIMDISLMFWIKRDQLMSFSYHFDWIITYFAVPAAGAICVQLLKISTRNNTTSFSLADAIQKMTLFIAFLEWVRPTDGNFALAQRLTKVVQKVLNHVLELPNREIVGMENRNENREGSDSTFPTSVTPITVSFGEMAGDDLDWLNTIDWTQGSWMEFS